MKNNVINSTTFEHFIERVKSLNKNFNDYDMSKVVWINTKTKIEIIHTICGNSFYILPGNFAHKTHSQGCPYCFGTKNKTQEQFISEVKEIFGDYYLLDRINYINYKTKVEVFCPECKTYVFINPANLLKGNKHRCTVGKQVGEARRFSLDLVLAIIKEKNPNIQYLSGEYKNNLSKLTFKCLICNHVWNPCYSNLMTKGCPKCGVENSRTKKIKGLDSALETLIKNGIKDLILVNPEDYTTKDKKYKFKCLKCDYVWNAKFQNIQSGKGCPNCNISNMERFLKSILEKHNIEFETQKTFQNCKYKKLLRFDFFLPKYNLAIECDGLQHNYYDSFLALSRQKDSIISQHSFKELQERDKIKEHYCQNNNISFLRIPYLVNYKKLESIITNTLF